MFNTSDKIKINPEIFPEDKLSNPHFQAGALNYPVLMLEWEMEVTDSFTDQYHGAMVATKILNDDRIEEGTIVYFRVEDCVLSKATKLKIEYTILGKQLKVAPQITMNREARADLMKERAKLRRTHEVTSKVMVANWKEVKKLDEALAKLNLDDTTVFEVSTPQLGTITLDCKEDDIPRKIRAAIRSKRSESRKSAPVVKVIAGDLRYEKLGGVASKPNQIGEIAKGFAIKVINEQKKPKTVEDNYVGIEIECFGKQDIQSMKEAFIKAGLKHYVNVGTDGSIRATNAKPNAMEIRVCLAEKDLDKMLPLIFKVISDNKMEVNDSCGTHVHLDMRNRNPELAYKNLYKVQDLMFAIQPAERRKNQYCARNTTSEVSISEFGSIGRYSAINTQSYAKHKTIELRLHHGTVDLADMKNWVSFLTTIVSLKSALKVDIGSVEELKASDLVSDEVIKHFNKKAKKYA